MSARDVLPSWLALPVAIAFLAPAAHAQEFTVPTAAPAFAGDMLERGLPAHGGLSFTALHVRRPLGLTTRSLVGHAGPGVVRAALGFARTGDADLGWSTAAAALGLTGQDGGLALRAAVRRDDAAPPGEVALGYELGGGAWVSACGMRGWVSAPQAWLSGAAPPLARGLAAGLDFDAGDGVLGIAREAPRRGFSESAAWSGRVGLVIGGFSMWTEFRDHPWRGGVGMAAGAGPFHCAAQVDSHPVLETTTRIALALRSNAGSR
ncbi:MAG: hypothetical protein ABIS67_09680 [Candidatus Eisenbacteria bacterium]